MLTPMVQLAHSRVLPRSLDHPSWAALAVRAHRYRTPATIKRPLAFLPLAPSPFCSPVGDGIFSPTIDGGSYNTFANPRLSFSGRRGSNPQPSPYAVYIASSSPQVIGQLSLPLASRTIESAGAQRSPLITGPAGGRPCPARTISRKNPSTRLPQSSSPPGSCDFLLPSPSRTATMSILGQTTTKLSPNPSAQ